MLRQFLLLIIVICLCACKTGKYTDEIDRSKFCSYFTVRVEDYAIDGKNFKSAYTQIDTIPGDKVLDFIQKHSGRFEYLINKTFIPLINADTKLDSILLNNALCRAISTDSFYRQFILLTNGEKQNSTKSLYFSKADMMKTASRFFMCDSIRESDTTIASYHICVGLNGVSELPSTEDNAALEAFCFEAIFENMGDEPAFISNFNEYIRKSSDRNKAYFKDFKTYLAAVRDDCYGSMEKDKDLENALLKYYRRNKETISFKIE